MGRMYSTTSDLRCHCFDHVRIYTNERAQARDCCRNDFSRLTPHAQFLRPGYSSLGYLKKLPVSVLKIDKSFVIGMKDDENDATIVRSSIDLAHNMGLTVVAEGVENADTFSLLTELGCDAAQGIFISQPMPAAKVRSWLRGSPWSPGLRN